MNLSNAVVVPDDNVVNQQLYILDPLSVIIKLAIISNKPVGTKLRIDNNVIYIQEPGPFQGLCRYFFKSNKSDLNFFNNPIEFACKHFLTKEEIEKNPKIVELFKCAQNGLQKLSETYRSSTILFLLLGFYMSLIDNYLDNQKNGKLFRKDRMTQFYTKEVLEQMYGIWTQEKIGIILNITSFLLTDDKANTNVITLENIMGTIDGEIQSLF
jgi:hypothetical protein